MKRKNNFCLVRIDEAIMPFVQIKLERKPLSKKEDTSNESSQITESIIRDIFGRKKRNAVITTTTATTNDEDYYAYENEADYDVAGIIHSKNKMDPKELMCLEYGESLLKWMHENPNRWGEFLTEKEMPKNPDYEKVLRNEKRRKNR
ncbi:unnamed protein product [Angiostrongylus costaricensis]|uniref:Chromo domain-containing protein n=1 Tax=Angiostrongylus costaricensis TaxID=334426 RepID=A0A0R3PRQ4_ANGCS|nr:unnamed protein product [Angiostrongylus costaricensis]